MFSAHISIFVNAPINSGGTNIPPATEADKISRLTFIETNILDPNSRGPDVAEILVQFASRTLTPRGFQIAQMIAKCHSFPNMYSML